MHYLVLVPFILQMLVILFDEYYFHLKRGLPLWERIGHPIDTLTVFACLIFVITIPYSPLMLKWYISLCVLSCLMVTKDEWVHKHVCPASEQWLHALLFVNHPIMLASVGLIWCCMTPSSAPSWVVHWIGATPHLLLFLKTQVVAISVFFLYQVIYWNFIWKEEKEQLQ
ncbi:MAG: hypothetical protein KR126chlam1_01371 [Chlamydiae bacterium]|nr:hypothetical protein [Chlamydiota bacterium]